MLPTTPSPQDDIEQAERILRRGREVTRRIQQAQAQVAEVTGRAENADGTVRAVSDGRGVITALTLDPRALRLGRAALGEQVTAVLRRAQHDAERQAAEIVDDALADTADLPRPLDESFIRERLGQIARELL
ncbi:YbaB/EbfC family nucleoid-associated protein [Nonomuraea sp. MG754425]|uniref:YbaB/EbfC family nucleoid-associated protein n=1 Tax=Nonomuraea sp. MG754425 TaxID=2570319 RepID=UPI001F433688|nr:YbaB/EbfC family nucleoid-associated protein [Nonomuraea sp. MG754425]MCF6475918.1 YbaB/EbfC family nucleoid-associated protein [Nonomuraea sp. MG754425]